MSLKVRIFEPYERQHLPDHPAARRRSRRPARDRGRHDQDTLRRGRAGGGPRPEPDRAAHHPATRQQGAGSRGHRRVRFCPDPDRDGVGRRQEARARGRFSTTSAPSSMPSTWRAARSAAAPWRAREPARSRGAAPGSGHPDGAVFRSAGRRRHSRTRKATRSSSGPIRVFTPSWARCMKSGNVEMTKANLSLLEALGNVGGLPDERANKTGVYRVPNGGFHEQSRGPGARFSIGPLSASVYLRRTAVRDAGSRRRVCHQCATLRVR